MRSTFSVFLALVIVNTARMPLPVSAVIHQLDNKCAVFIGEDHERYDNHLDQLQIIHGLYRNAPGHWAIGIEYIQRRFQPALDAFIDKTIDEPEFLRRSEYFERWGYDYRLYRPIFRFARDHQIPMIALNAERELTDAVDKTGIAGLAAPDRARLPEQIEPPDTAYRERLRKIFDEHPGGGNFDRFVDVQMTWDETMAASVADYLGAHPGKAMIVLAGEGHIAFGSGIPDRVKRRLPGIETAVLLPADKTDADLQGADYLLISRMESVPPAGKLGVTFNSGGQLSIKTVAPRSAAAQAGLRPGDSIIAAENHPVHSLTDFRLAVMDKKPGQRVRLRIHRNTAADTEVQLTLQK